MFGHGQHAPGVYVRISLVTLDCPMHLSVGEDIRYRWHDLVKHKQWNGTIESRRHVDLHFGRFIALEIVRFIRNCADVLSDTNFSSTAAESTSKLRPN